MVSDESQKSSFLVSKSELRLQEVIEGQIEDYVSSLTDHIGPHNCVNYQT